MAGALRLLLIEDSRDDAELVVRALRQGEYDVTSRRVDTPEELLAALAGPAWDLVIADYTMPLFSGMAALALLRERNADMPFIFVSGTIGEDAAVAAMKNGANDYIMKGHLKRLVPAVERELRDAQVRRERRRAEQRLLHLAYHDALTDLPNRSLLFERLQQAVLGVQRDTQPLTLLVMDLDRFKEINDTLGHHAGDCVLQIVAARLRELLRGTDTVARLGGDEFALMLRFTDIEGAMLASRKILKHLERPMVIDGHHLTVHASIGIAHYPSHGSTAEALLQKADVAMYLAKADASGIAVYTPERHRHTHHRLTLVSELKQGLDAGQFVLDYQPIVHLRTSGIVAVEGLVRWNHPRKGRLLPAEFIDLAEQTGLIDQLTNCVMDQALGEWSGITRWTPATISVNLSPRNLLDQQLPDRVADLLRARSMAPERLTLEITENLIMSDPARSMACLTRLHEMGVRLAVDDFGTGYSSLSYLRRLPVNELKIDRSFVIGLATSDDEVIVRSTIDLAHNLGLTVIAEGVETANARDRLVALGCDAAQGIFLSEPRPAEAIRQWIDQLRPLSLV
jgi:diguanylate cyclase (GGDEF)-like protein